MKASFELSTLSCLTILLYPFLNYYGYGIFSLAFFLMLFYIFYAIKKKGIFLLAFQLPFLLFILYFLFSRIMCATSLREGVAPSIMLIFVFWGMLNIDLSFDSFIKWYRRISWIIISFFFFQECMFQFLGYRVLGILTFLPLTIGDSSFDVSEWSEISSEVERSSAFFSEPAHMAQYLLPLLAIELLYLSNNKISFRCVIYIMTLIGLTSGNALAGLLVVFLFYFIKKIKETSIYISVLFILLFALSISFVFYKVKTTEYYEKIEKRSEELESDQLTISSGFIRIFRGYYIWDEMSASEKLFGMNSTERVKEKIRHCDVAFAFGEDDVYVNCFQSFIIYNGIIGTFIFSLFIYYLWKGNNMAGRCCIILFIVFSFISAIYFSVNNMLLLLISSWLMKKQHQGSSNLRLIYCKISSPV